MARSSLFSSLPWSHAGPKLPILQTAHRGPLFKALPWEQTRSNTTTSSSPSSSVNPTEISHFNALASSWWDPHGPSRILHQMNPLRHDFISGCLASFPHQQSSLTGLRYLDIGCGGGIFAESAVRLSSTAHVLAIDPSSEGISVAQNHARSDPLLMQPGRLRYRHASIEDLPLPSSSDEQFDVVSLFEVIEHIDYPSPFLERCLPFVKPGGWLVLSTIARTWTSWFTTKLVAEDLTRLVPRGTHDWDKYVNPSEMMAWFGTKDGWASPSGSIKVMGVAYVPGMGWVRVPKSEGWGNYFIGVRRDV